MIKEIILYRRQGMSFRKIAEKLNSTVGKVHYQWTKNGMDDSNFQENSVRKVLLKEPKVKTQTLAQSQKESYLVTKLLSEHKLVSYWKMAPWQKHLITSYFNQDINLNIIIFRIYDVTDIYFNGSNAHSLYEFQLSEESNEWTIKGIKPGRSYLTEIGYKIKQHHFFPVLRSNAVHNLPEGLDQLPSTPPHWETMTNQQLDQPIWKEQVSTYSYYENINEENDKNGSC